MKNHTKVLGGITMFTTVALIYSLFVPIACYMSPDPYSSIAYDLNAFSVFGEHAYYWLGAKPLLIILLILTIIVTIFSFIVGLILLTGKGSKSVVTAGLTVNILAIVCTTIYLVVGVICIARGVSYLTWCEIAVGNTVFTTGLYAYYRNVDKKALNGGVVSNSTNLPFVDDQSTKPNPYENVTPNVNNNNSNVNVSTAKPEVGELVELKKLFDQGVLTKEEFEAMKNKIINK